MCVFACGVRGATKLRGWIGNDNHFFSILCGGREAETSANENRGQGRKCGWWCEDGWCEWREKKKGREEEEEERKKEKKRERKKEREEKEVRPKKVKDEVCGMDER